MPLLIESIGISVVISILLSELVGISAAGIVVPGYLAYYMNQPVHLSIILMATLYTFLLERLISKITILYGKRLMALDILSSFIFVYAFENFIFWIGFPIPVIMDTVGYFIPALIVIFIGVNGFLNTILSLCLLTLIVRIILLLLNHFNIL